jgi:riboflavin kinase / FMN adenylyltransferase
MQYFDSYLNLPPDVQGCVLVIGNFDGVHRGHQALLAHGRKIAQSQGRQLGVLTFEPHPKALFRADEPPSRITPAAMKAWRLKKCGVDVVFSLPFDWDFASQSAGDFIQNILIQGIGAAHVVVGYDFRFGQMRKGTQETIMNAGIPVTVVEEVKIDTHGDLCSSRIRQLLRHGEILEANQLLGWDWEIWGEVFKGDQRGRELGYPTANIRLEDVIHPAYGIYAAWAQIEGDERWYMAATNIGIRPMFTVPVAQVETFIFDFDREIYGKVLRVKPVARLRSEAKFNSVEDLIVQMEIDCAQARKVLSAL